jgi:hypothetical protein
MNNPRPCECGHTEREHGIWGCNICLHNRQGCFHFRGVRRKEPLRAQRRICPHGRLGVPNMVDRGTGGPFVEEVVASYDCPPECHASA